MQTNTVSSQSNVPAPQRASVAPNVDASQFSAALNREIEQRQELAPPAPAPQPKPAAPSTSPASGQPQAADKAPQPEPAKPQAPKHESRKTAKSADDKDGDNGKDGAKAAEHPATAQVTDMLALVASLKPVQEAAVAKTAGAHAPGAATGIIGKAGAGDAGHLAALQAALKGQGKDDARTAAGAVAGQDASRNAAADALAAAADGKAAAKDGIDLRAFQDAAQLKLHPDAAPAREALAEAAALKDPAPAAPLAAPMQPVAVEMAQAAAVAGDQLSARVGSQAWENQVGQKIVWMVAGEEQSASLTLNPPDLGPMQVVLSVTNDQASVTFSSNQQEVRQALENALPRLREMMSDSGIALGNASVNAGMPDQQQAQSGGGQPHGAGRPLTRFDAGPAIADTSARPAPRVATLGGRGAVDTFA